MFEGKLSVDELQGTSDSVVLFFEQCTYNSYLCYSLVSVDAFSVCLSAGWLRQFPV